MRMGRGLLILLTFAVVLGLFVCWGPLDLTLPWHTAASTAERTAPPAAKPGGPTGEPVRIAIEPATDTGVAVAPVAAAVPAVTSPLLALPLKATAGFPPAPSTPLSNEEMGAEIKQARLLRERGQLVDARDLLSDTYLAHRLSGEQRVTLAGELEPLAWEILVSRQLLDGAQLYQVQHGDTLSRVARPCHMPHEFVMAMNNIRSERSIRPNQTLKLVQGPFDVLIDLSAFELTVLHHGRFVRRYPVGIGRDERPTPVGLFFVNTKIKNPIKWPDPIDRRKIAGGAPDNPFGTRWIDIGDSYGIHGTCEPDSIGCKTSQGCIRMQNADVEQLYDMLTEGGAGQARSRVLIRS